MSTTSRSRTVPALVIAAAAVAFSLAGCGGGNDSAAATNTTTAEGAAAGGDADAFRDCLKEHGVDLPDDIGQGGPGQGQPPTDGQAPTGPPSGGQPFGDDPELQEAFNACQDQAPAGALGGAPDSQALQAYSSCLRDHGVDIPDQSTSTSTGQPAAPPTFDRNDPDFAAASEACQALLPTTTTTTEKP